AAGDINQLENAVTFEQGFLEADDFYDLDYPEILRHTEDTTFSSYSKRKMIIASREIEEVAWKRGEGNLYSCFQKLSVLKEQWDLYVRIGERGVGVNAYGMPDWEPPETDIIDVHEAENGEIEDNWFVVYDGAGDDGKKRALLAEQRDDDWYGFWTYDAKIVDEITEYINSKWEDA
ncbi:MAG: histidine kinase, partial [Halobacteria archaeon]|nr:histidine kinase [Halobacteria archaeon]